MKFALVLLCIGAQLVSCTSSVIPSEAPATSLPAIQTPEPFLLPTPTFEVVAWVDDPNPQIGSRVMLYGSLIKNGVYLGGMAMRATWPDEDQERGVPNCSVQVIYESGVCIIETEGFQQGVFVPITVTFEYLGKIYRGQTGFTPR